LSTHRIWPKAGHGDDDAHLRERRGTTPLSVRRAAAHMWAVTGPPVRFY